MPELPEVETIRRCLTQNITGERFAFVEVRQPRLRRRVAPDFSEAITGSTVTAVARRGKYLIFHLSLGNMLIHLGMSGRLSILPNLQVYKTKHDHIDWVFYSGKLLRYRDPRRFGMVLWTEQNPLQHDSIKSLGPEPFDDIFNPQYVLDKSFRKILCIKNLIMDSHFVSGIGNIYANESLFHARINPCFPAGKINKDQACRLIFSVRSTLSQAIASGGTTILDYRDPDGNLGYFQQNYHVYRRQGQPCLVCSNRIRRMVLGQRSTFWCPNCQH